MNDNSTSVETTRVNRLSDHEFLLALAYLNQQGQTEYGFPPYNWELKFYTSSPLNFFTVSCRGGVMLNCQREGDMVRVIMDGHKLSTGVLRARSTIYIPDSNFPDGTRRVVDEHEFKTLFVSGHGTFASGPQLELLFPYVKGEPGKPFTYDDFTPEQLEGLRGPQGESLTFSDLTPEQIEELRGPKGDPFTYDDFTPEQLEGLRGPQGNSLTYDDLTPGQIAELQRPATEAAQLVSGAINAATATNNAITEAEQSRAETEQGRVEAEQQRVEAEALRVEAEQTRVEAEQERAREFAGFAQDINKGSLRLFDLQWKQAGGSIIVSGETYGLNGINDLSLSEAIDILAQYANASTARSLMASAFQNSKLRTTFPLRIGASVSSSNMTSMFSGSAKLETLVISGGMAYTHRIASAFSGCSRLRKIDGGAIRVRDLTAVSHIANAFQGCAALEDVRISNLGFDISFADSPLLSLGSISYLIAQRLNTNTFTITVHPDVYAKLTGDTTNAAAAALSADELAQWQDVLGQAVAKNISFATA